MSLSKKQKDLLYKQSLLGYRDDPEGLLRLWQQAGRIPSEYSSWDELSYRCKQFKQSYRAVYGKNPKADVVNEFLGINFKPTVENPSIFDQKGNISVRALDDAIHPAVQIWLDADHPGTYPHFDEAVRYDWRVRAKQATNELKEASGGKRADRGHVTPGSRPASTYGNWSAQDGAENSALRDVDRVIPSIADEYGFSKNHFEAA